MSARRLSRFLLACGGWLIAATAWAQYAQVPTDAAGFTAYAGRELTALRPGATVGVHAPLVLDYATGHRPAVQITLDQAYASCRGAPAACAASVHRFLDAAATAAVAQDAPVHAAQLRLLLRLAAYATEARARLEASHRQPLGRPIAGDLWAFVVVDLPHATRLLTDHDLASLSPSKDAAFSLALRQTEAALPPLAEAEHDVLRRHVGFVAGDPSYEAARFADHATWAPIAARMDGHLLVTVPSNGTIVFGDDRVRGMAADLRDIAARERAKSTQPLTETVFAWTETGWRVVRLDPAPPPMPTHPEAGSSPR